MVDYLPNSVLKTKTKIDKHGSSEFCSVMAIFSWVQGLPRSVDSIPSEIPMQKTNFLITSWCQLQMASWLGVSAHIYFPISVHLSVWALCLFSRPLWVYICASGFIIICFTILTCHILYGSYGLVFDCWYLFDWPCSLLLLLLCLLPPYVPACISNSNISISFSHSLQVWRFSSKYVSL